MFNTRDQTYRDETKEIFINIFHVLEGIIVFLGLEDDAKAKRLAWEDVKYVNDDSEEMGGIVIVTGVISNEPGDMAKLANGESIQVTEENMDYFDRVIRVGVPLDIVNAANADQILEFLEATEDMEVDEDELEALLKERGEFKPISEGRTGSVENDFDLENLSDDQRNSLQLFLLSKRQAPREPNT